jgi:hypothetical protein
MKIVYKKSICLENSKVPSGSINIRNDLCLARLKEFPMGLYLELSNYPESPELNYISAIIETQRLPAA